jgi:serine/threonine-protein kinase
MKRHLVLALAFSLFPAVVWAEDVSEREAQKLYDEGLELHQARREEEAYVKFRVAYAAKRSPVILFALARTEQLTGRHADAIRHYEQYLRYPETHLITPAEREKAARFAAEARKSVGFVRLGVPANARVSLDNETLAPEDFKDGPTAVTPGAHVVSVAFGRDTRQERFAVSAGETRTLAFSFDAPAAPPPPATDSTKARVVVPLILGGAGLVALGVGTFLFISGGAKRDDADRLREKYPGADYRCSSGGADCTELADLANSAESQKTLGVVFLIGGGALLAGAATAFVLWPRAATTTGMRVTPILSTTGAGASVGGHF